MNLDACSQTGIILVIASNVLVLLVEYFVGKKKPLGASSTLSLLVTAGAMMLFVAWVHYYSWRSKK